SACSADWVFTLVIVDYLLAKARIPAAGYSTLDTPTEGSRPKYRHVKGSQPILFGSDTLQGRETALLCEGEFDAMLLAQEAGDLVGVATLAVRAPASVRRLYAAC
ncbi:MAG: hypothetical protein ACYCW6_29145, partial [Candidatus Xenobia bacterium]